MAKCIDCAWFPWVPGADFSNLPAIRCHPQMKARRWIGNSAQVEHECPRFKRVKKTGPVKLSAKKQGGKK